MKEERIRDSENDTLFNMGLATQQHIHNLFTEASKFYLQNEPMGRVKCLLNIKRISYSECTPEMRKEFDATEKKLTELTNSFNNMIRLGCISYDLNKGRYLILKNKDAFALINAIDKETNSFEENLRIKLANILFPKTGDKRFALG